MDIPDAGAIFTLGKSQLADNTQSYFFIKNDPVKLLNTGPSQSAVVCESGRLFVWGENQFGQLGIGNTTNEIITKPTCVKSLKLLGLKIRDISFGIGWCVIITESNEIFFAGRNIYPRTAEVFKDFQEYRIQGENYYLVKKPIRLNDFDEVLQNQDKENNIEIFEKCVAGNDHFILQTSSGRLFGWGYNDSNQLGLTNSSYPTEPIQFNFDYDVSQLTCGPKSTLILSKSNKLYLCGHLNDTHFATLTELPDPQEATPSQIAFINISRTNEIFLITEFGSIYRSSESTRRNLHFQKFYDYDHDEYGPVEKLLKGSSFYAALTKSHKFFTTFSESGHHLKTFREISKFKNLKVLDAAIGDRHILILGVPKGSRRKSKRSADSLSKTYTVATSSSINSQSGQSVTDIPDEKDEDYMDNDLNGNKLEALKPNTPITDEARVENLESVAEESEAEDKAETKAEMNGNDMIEAVVNENDIEKISEKKTEYKELEDQIHENNKNENFETENEATNTGSSEAHINDSNNGEMTSANNSADNPTTKISASNSMNTDNSMILENNLESQPIPKKSPSLVNVHMDGKLQTDIDGSNNGSVSSLSDYNEKIDNDSNTDSPSNSNKTAIKNEFVSDNIELRNSNSHVHEESPPSIEAIREELIEKTSSELTNLVLQNSTELVNQFENDMKDTSNQNSNSQSKPKLPPLKSFSRSSLMNASPSVKFDRMSAKSNKSVKSVETKVRPRTPYPSETPQQTIKKHQSSGDDDLIEHTSLNFTDSLESSPVNEISKATTAENHQIEEIIHKSSPKSEYTIKQRFSTIKNDFEEELEIEVERKSELIDKAVEDEIRFINDGIDVTEKVAKSMHTRTASTLQNFNSDLNVLEKNVKNLLNVEKMPDDSSKEIKTMALSVEDDERTTASVNSNKEINDDVERFKIDEKKEIFEEIKDEIIEVGGKGKKTVKRFFNGIKNTGKGISCKNQGSIKVEDQPPEYTPVDQHLEQKEPHDKTSRVCTIL